MHDCETSTQKYNSSNQPWRFTKRNKQSSFLFFFFVCGALFVSYRRIRKELCNHKARLAEVKELNELQAKQAMLDIGGVRFHTSFETKIPFSFNVQVPKFNYFWLSYSSEFQQLWFSLFQYRLSFFLFYFFNFLIINDQEIQIRCSQISNKYIRILNLKRSISISISKKNMNGTLRWTLQSQAGSMLSTLYSNLFANEEDEEGYVFLDRVKSLLYRKESTLIFFLIVMLMG